MSNYQFNYLENFKCSANNCKRTCCAGWEIFIDKKTIKQYKKFAKKDARFLSFVDYNEKKFILKEGKRCPFLNKTGLCDIITELGEDNICQVCTDHPRFRNFIGNRVETGLGFACEQAVKIVLDFDKEIFPVQVGKKRKDRFNSKQKLLLDRRKEVVQILYSKESNIDERLKKVCKYCNTDLRYLNARNFKNEFLSLERLDCSWTEKLEFAFNTDILDDNLSVESEWCLTQFAVNSVYRHSLEVQDETEFKVGVCLAVLLVDLAKKILLLKGVDRENLYNIVLEISLEAEYSKENVDKIRTAIMEKVPLFLDFE